MTAQFSEEARSRGYTTFPLMRFKPRFSAVLQICRRNAAVVLHGRPRKVYVLTAVNTVSSRSLRYIYGFMRFSAVVEPHRTSA